MGVQESPQPIVVANNDKNRRLCPGGGIGRRSGLTWAQWLVGEQHSFPRPKSAISDGVRVQVPSGAPSRTILIGNGSALKKRSISVQI